MRYQKMWLMLGLGLGCACLFAEPVVIYRGGPLVSVEPYSRVAKASSPLQTVPTEVLRTELRSIQQKALQAIQAQPPYFPFKTEGVSIGKVLPKQIQKLNIPRPFFVLGGDQRSLAWLQKNRDRFKAAGAIGFLVEANSWEEYAAVKKTAGEVPVERFQWSGFMKTLGIDHYPVFVTSTSIEQ